MNLTESSHGGVESVEECSITQIVEDAIRNKKWSSKAHKLFQALDLVCDCSSVLELDRSNSMIEYIAG